MVRMSRYVVMYPYLILRPRSNWKEGGKDAFNEHGYAGKRGDIFGAYLLLIVYVHSFAK